MKANRRWLRHGLFWLLYFAVNLFNELYLSASFSAEPSAALLLGSVQSQLLLLLVKVPAVYYVLDSFLRRWPRTAARGRLLAEGAFVLLLFLLAYRLVIHKIVWPYVFREEVRLTVLQLLARCCYSLLDLLQVIGIAAAIRLFRQRLESAEREKDLVREKFGSELLQLKSQINPHFLFNTLNSIYTLTYTRAPMAAEAVAQLSGILRFMLYETPRATIAIGEELKIVESYIQLQRTRFGSKAETRMEVSLEDPHAPVTPLLLLPLVENAFKHGAGGAEGTTAIQVRVQQQQDRLMVAIRNPVIVRPGDTGEGIGLSNIRRRLELLYRDYDFTFGQQDDMFLVQLNLNLSSYAGAELYDRGR